MKWIRSLAGIALRSDWRWLSSSVRPSLILDQRLRPGWYLLTIRVHSDQRRLHGRFQRVQERSLIAGRLRRRVVRINRANRTVLFEMAGLNAALKISKLRLVALPGWRARHLIRRKLLRLHPAYHDTSRFLNNFARQWRDYNQLLSHHQYSLVDYDQWIEKVEVASLLRESAAAVSAAGAGAPVESPAIPSVVAVEPSGIAEQESAERQAQPRVAVWLWGDRSQEVAVRRSLQSVEEQFAGGFELLSGNASLGEADEQQWLLLLAVGDTLAPHALRRFSHTLRIHPDARVIYADEDLIDEQGHRFAPNFKPAWNLDFFLTNPGYSHCWWLRSDVVLAACHALNEVQIAISPLELLMEIALSCPAANIIHIPEVLYHGSGDTEPFHANATSVASLSRCLQRHGVPAEVQLRDSRGHRLHWPLPDRVVKVSVIIPTRDHGALLQQCVDSLLAHPQTQAELEFLIVDNGSTEPSSLEVLRTLNQRPGFRVLPMPGPFNYSLLNNQAVQEAQGEVLLLINNDVQAISHDWLGPLLTQALRPEVGAVGAKLLFADDTVQHAGIVLGIGGIAGHAHKYFPAEASGYQQRLQLAHRVSAVTAAVLAIRKSLFQEMGGLDSDTFAVNYNDVDLCLRLHTAGYRNIYCPDAVFYHHESRSRGEPSEAEAFALWQRERGLMQERWGELLAADPFYNPHLSLHEEDFSLRLDGGPSALPRRGP